MSEFVQMMKDLTRMCNKYFEGENWVCNKTCPMYGFEVCSKPTAKYPVPLEIGQDLAHEIECVITAWAKDNPEPVYPTFAEWLNSIGVTISDRPFPAPNIPVYVFQVTAKMFEPIPADIAQKLGIEPKEKT